MQNSNLYNLRNFSGGPGVLPLCVLQQLSEEIINVPEMNLSLLGISHRSDWFANVVVELEQRFLQLLNLSADEYKVLFLQGGATQQFAQIPYYFYDYNKQAKPEYIVSGYWSKLAFAEAQNIISNNHKIQNPINKIWDGENIKFEHLPSQNDIVCNDNAAYLHYISNETVEGLQFNFIPNENSKNPNLLRIIDMSSDLLSRPIEANKFGIIYAHAQKNLGPAGITVIIIRKNLYENKQNLGWCSAFDYYKQAEKNSIYNTPPVFAIYTTLLVLRWMQNEIGNLQNMEKINNQKAALLYNVLDEIYQQNQFYIPQVPEKYKESRSIMNVSFHLQNAEITQKFLQQAEQQAKLFGLKGHRSLGGIRASIYNAMPLKSVELLADFLRDFWNKNK